MNFTHNQFKMTKSRRMRCTGHVARMGGKRTACKVFDEKVRRKEAARNT
jgi:hypothetical protein